MYSEEPSLRRLKCTVVKTGHHRWAPTPRCLIPFSSFIHGVNLRGEGTLLFYWKQNCWPTSLFFRLNVRHDPFYLLSNPTWPLNNYPISALPPPPTPDFQSTFSLVKICNRRNGNFTKEGDGVIELGRTHVVHVGLGQHRDEHRDPSEPNPTRLRKTLYFIIVCHVEFLDEIQTKVLRVFLYSFAMGFLFLQTRATSYSF